MSDDTQAPETNEEEEELQAPSEIDTLKARATQMGISFHPNIGLEKLKTKINKQLTDVVPEPEEDTPSTSKSVATKTGNKIKTVQKESIAMRNKRLRREQSKLVRIRVNCMNPSKKEHEGELFTVSNSVVGTFKKYVPFNAEDGWHVPQMVLTMMQERQCQIFVTTKGPRGNKVRKGKLIKEFAIEILPPLSSGEIKKLATKQAMADNLA